MTLEIQLTFQHKPQICREHTLVLFIYNYKIYNEINTIQTYF